MNECLSTDALVAIGAALEWDVAQGLRHLEACDECRTDLEVLQLTRSAFSETEPVDADAVQRISAALSAAARGEKVRVRRTERWINAIEALMAGLTALIILVSSDIRIESLTSGVLGFALGAALLVCGRILARGMRALGYTDAHA